MAFFNRSRFYENLQPIFCLGALFQGYGYFRKKIPIALRIGGLSDIRADSRSAPQQLSRKRQSQPVLGKEMAESDNPNRKPFAFIRYKHRHTFHFSLLTYHLSSRSGRRLFVRS